MRLVAAQHGCPAASLAGAVADLALMVCGVPDPDQDSACLIGREVLGLNEFLFEGFEGFIMQLELDLERPIRHALTLTEKGNHLIEDSVKVHQYLS